MAITRTAPVRERDETGKPTGPGVRDIGPAAARVDGLGGRVAGLSAELLDGPAVPMGSGPVERTFQTPQQPAQPRQEAQTMTPAPDVHREPSAAAKAHESRMRGNAAMLEGKKRRMSDEGRARIAAGRRAQIERDRLARLSADEAVVASGKAGQDPGIAEVGFAEAVTEDARCSHPGCIFPEQGSHIHAGSVSADPAGGVRNVEPVEPVEISSVVRGWRLPPMPAFTPMAVKHAQEAPLALASVLGRAEACARTLVELLELEAASDPMVAELHQRARKMRKELAVLLVDAAVRSAEVARQ